MPSFITRPKKGRNGRSQNSKRREKMRLGTFTKTEEGNFEGAVKTMLFDAKLRIVKNTADKGPDYFIFEETTEAEVGIGKKKTSKEGNAYILCKIDDPTLPSEIWCALNSHEDQFNLNWSRPMPQKDPNASGAQDSPFS